MAELARTLDVNPFLDIFKPELAVKHPLAVSTQARVPEAVPSQSSSADAPSPPMTDVLL